MFERIRFITSVTPALIRLLRSDYPDVDDVLGALDRWKQLSRERLEANPLLREVAARPMMPSLPARHELLALPEGSVGHQLGAMLAEQDFDAIDQEFSDDSLGRVRAWAERSHDLWHVVTGFGTDLPGELGLQAFYVAQIDSRISLLILATALLRHLRQDRERLASTMDAIATGWTLGRTGASFVDVDWHAELETPLAVLRARLHIAPVMGALADGRYAEDRAQRAA